MFTSYTRIIKSPGWTSRRILDIWNYLSRGLLASNGKTYIEPRRIAANAPQTEQKGCHCYSWDYSRSVTNSSFFHWHTWHFEKNNLCKPRRTYHNDLLLQLTWAVLSPKTDTAHVARILENHWITPYRILGFLLADKRTHVVSKLF